MIDVIEYRPEHLESIRPRLKQIHWGELPDKIDKGIVLAKFGIPLAIFGYISLGAGVIHLWAFISEDIKSCMYSFCKACRKLLKFIEVDAKLRRIQMDVRTSYDEGHRFAEFLGFKAEGVMRNFAVDGEDCTLFARVA